MANHPNIILIMTDQQRYDSIAASGYPYMKTPTLDRLHKEGSSFSNCFITGAACVPSRASLFSGFYPHSIGVMRNGIHWSKTWVGDLKEKGYRCVNIGKMHVYPFDKPAGFDERYIVENKDRFLEAKNYFDEWDKALAANGLVKQQRALYRKRSDYKHALGAFHWELPERFHSDMFIGDMANWWLRSYPKTEPLFLQIGFVGPHPPYDPTPPYHEMYRDAKIPMPRMLPSDLEGQPRALKVLRQHHADIDHDSIVWSMNPSPEQLKRLKEHYYANVTMIDAKIESIMQTLNELGYLDNSIVIFTTDHGDSLGDHGHIQKWNMYEEVVHVPLIFWSKDEKIPAQEVKGMCQLHDIGPTLFEMLGMDHSQMEGRSLLPALQKKEWQPYSHVFCEEERDSIMTDAKLQTMVRSEDWKFVHFLEETDGQVYDLKNDPAEEVNLWQDALGKKIRQEAMEVLCEWHLQSNLQTQAARGSFIDP
ncbi:MAG: sulfatase-like hydrolase/transferase [SAR324 cluster bacterium]|nr:sulfatase-like hydrolase/transferase [SAR324 cluster bacterium]